MDKEVIEYEFMCLTVKDVIRDIQSSEVNMKCTNPNHSVVIIMQGQRTWSFKSVDSYKDS